ncbi:peptidase M50 [Kocuria dechangensis]|uniref:Zinc metalloprotease n=1 Tax=Kocuria dechangensis TaxID=1176249 RepID=A0A917LZR5_9MICC|nr:site-2 protease family protein [Kocuria dechangensis]GGG68415.1 peptidase M50 [Kocuria dechangensis]
MSPAGRSAGIPLGRLGGVPVTLSWSWFVIAAVTVVLYTPVLMARYPELGGLNYAVALGFALTLALSVLLHELAHAWTGRAFGWPTGRIVLTLLGGHTSFGDVRTAPLASAVVSLAGPAVNLALGLAGLAALRLGERPDTLGWILLDLTAWANLIVGVFNVLPGLPLDGGRVVEAVVWAVTGRESSGTVAAAWAGRVLASGLVLGVVATGLWRQTTMLLLVLLIAAFMWQGATASLRAAAVLTRMHGISATTLARPAVGVPASASLGHTDRVVTAFLARRPADARPEVPDVVALDADGRVVGVLEPAAANAVPAARRESTPLTAVLHGVAADAVLDAGLREEALLRAVAARQHPRWVVTGPDGAPVGVLSTAALERLLTG